MEKETERNMRSFDMDMQKTDLTQKRGLSRYYSGKARSFVCMAEVRCVEDLKKQEHPQKRKKHSERLVPPLPCRRVSSSAQFASPILGM
ncbi:protein OXIDATIVE STRESS 3 LIKE 3-like isoform X2 [Rhododendron vialii]|uniref:protein OXIDATIVE STRESS 3 LIKE 3-like isoform X2 n=1 Tax=Rhododendron vialii TaxID=182163 RepID=UPI00265F08C6|nr:protein OXIDATIVE STRESS 3 LIKE 3-like isoform X2 [Rhododendron vialii]